MIFVTVLAVAILVFTFLVTKEVQGEAPRSARLIQLVVLALLILWILANWFNLPRR